MGSRWCVGDGASISIWNDKWIPTNGGQKVISPMSQFQENAKVKELLTPSLSWNTNLIEEIFLPFEANLISQIPLRGTHKPDRQVWARTSNGMFSVQSAYQMLVEDLKIKESGTSTTSQRWKVFWKNLWSVKVPQKIKVFMWKACSNILPTCTKLFDRNIVSNFSCSVCGDEAETRDHLFMECPAVTNAWRAFPIYLSTLQPGMRFVDWVEEILAKLSHPETEIFCTTAWFIWRHRNEVWTGTGPREASQISTKATRYAIEFLEATSEVPQIPNESSKKWIPPQNPNAVKVNVASVWFKNQRKIGIGMAVRNSQGNLLAASSEKVTSEEDFLGQSAQAVLHTLKLLISIGFFVVEIECNNSYLISLINSGEDLFSETGWILEDIKELLPAFSSISFNCTPKVCNSAALALASFSKENEVQSVWLEDCPSFLFPIVSSELV
uniref:Reverse transcriptase zinc-binding domain-containing protein n=1 Tax=Fagus sylvatica TaxID=28930 RepID=A0A2N9EM79_FAGSY